MSEDAQKLVRAQGLCGALLNDGRDICILEHGHGEHDTETCAGCAQDLLYPHQHATACPVFKHADVQRMGDFLDCGCGLRCVSYADHFEHLRDVRRGRRMYLAELDAGGHE